MNDKYLKRSDLKKREGLLKYHSMRKAEAKLLLQSKSNLESVCCLVCGGNSTDKLFDKDGFNFDQCTECGIVYVNPRPKPSALVKWYEKSKASEIFQKEIIEPTLDARIERIFKSRVEWINKIISTPDKVLDVGCSYGIFLSLAANVGWVPHGIEFSDIAIERCKANGIIVSNQPIENSVFPEGYFDLITLWEVLEP